MKRYLINGLVLTAVMGAFTIAQETKTTKPVTQASIIRSVLTLSDKAEKNGLHRESAILMDAAKTMLDKKIPVKAICETDMDCQELENKLRSVKF